MAYDQKGKQIPRLEHSPQIERPLEQYEALL